MDFDYQIEYDPTVLDRISDIENYISNVLFSPVAARNRVETIFDDIAQLKKMPASYPSADKKIGVQISKTHETKFKLIVGGKYLVFFFVDENIIYISHLLPTETDYMSLFE
ncbi:type II toxin-antitoxin system RelE/ParE family toxin [Lactococcus kimchii]|uniref:type II toxin-antitoxin system RelE/ParE family toxin n=1 Tax=Lactococcus sp. S-13 TaxID=2507158 RepID=UPI001680ACE7|nr:type II toxin-antitoxin system RelE/ParE family toxin [Lactococcus sp. S-13]